MEQRNLEEDDDLGEIRQRLDDLKTEEIRTEMSIVFSVRTKEDLVSVVVSSSILCRTM